jgi:hypothetical protein
MGTASNVARKQFFSSCGLRAPKFTHHWLRYFSNIKGPTPIKLSDFGTDVSDVNTKLWIELHKDTGPI